MSGNCLTWESRTYDYRSARRSAILKSAFNPLANPFSPIAHTVRKITEGYYERTLSDAVMARRFAEYYLRGIEVGPKTTVLDHGCGKGRLIGLLSQLGARVSGQDILRNPWWDHFTDGTFQVVSPEYSRLPWAAQQFNIVLDFGVVEYFSEEDLGALAVEVRRTLKDGGHWVVWTANPTGRGIHARQSPHMHTADSLEYIARGAGFEMLSRRYEGLAFRRFPILLGTLRTIRNRKTFDYFSYGSAGSRPVTDLEKSKYVVVLRKATS